MSDQLLDAALERWEGWELGDWPIPDLGTMDTILDAARKVANPVDELWWCKQHARPIDTFDGLQPKSCLYQGRPGECNPVAALTVLGIDSEDTPT